MEIHTFDFPIRHNQLRRICSILREEAVFIPSFPSTPESVYEPLTYLKEQIVSRTETIILADRNLVTRWVGSVRGDTPSGETRLAAAILAFAQCAEILIDPCMAFHEQASTSGNQSANEELALFRVADNVNPKYWGYLALGLADDVRSGVKDIPTIPQSELVDFARPLHYWQVNYVIALKIAELELRAGDSERRMKELLDWMYHEFLFSASGVVLGAYYLAPNTHKRRLLKSLRSDDRERAIAGIRNQSWDMTLITEWIRRTSEQRVMNRLTLLATLDHNLRTLAGMTVDGAPHILGGGISELFTRLWGRKGERIATLANHYQSKIDDTERRLNKPAELLPLKDWIATGEQVIRSWSPSKKR